MGKRTVIIIISVIVGVAIAAGLGVLIWWLVSDGDDFTVIRLEGDGIGDVEQTAAFTRIRGSGDMFWWFYPTAGSARSTAPTRPIILWLDSITGLPPSLLANFGMFGPYDLNLNRRNDSWIDDYNLLFIDAPLGTGFSTALNADQIPGDLNENTNHLLFTLESFYSLHEEYSDTPLYIFGQGHGAQLAVSLAIQLSGSESFLHNLNGVVIANGIISPALALTKLGFYLEELAYIDGNGRSAIEGFSNEVNGLVNGGQMEEAFDKYISLNEFVNENAGAIAVNLGYIVEKLTREATRDFGLKQYIQDVLRSDDSSFMDETIAPALGIDASAYDDQREDAIQAFRSSFMLPATDKVEYLLQNTNVTVTIYNGNLDAVSNTPGQLLWVDNLVWPGQAEFRNSSRQTLIINSLVEGYFRETSRLRFYWMNAAGVSVPLDSPVAMRRVLQRITQN